MNFNRMAEQLILHEGLKLKSYLDTEGNWTVGVGYNISGRGVDFFQATIGRTLDDPIERLKVTREESLKVLHADMKRVHHVIPVHFPEYAGLDEIRQRVVLDMAFNMGFSALGFKNTKAAVIARDWSKAAKELYKSKWARQVGDGEGGKFDRCDRLSKMLLTGNDYVQ